MHVLITANSPGEVAGWVQPVAESIRRQAPGVPVTLVLPPCQYASGKEQQVAASWQYIDRIVTLRGFLRALLLGRAALGLPRTEDVRVLFLGGDVLHAVALAKRLRAPCYAYLAKPRWARHIRTTFVPDEASAERFAARAVPPNRYGVVGQLALDSAVVTRAAAEVRQALGGAADGSLIALLPGSRPVFTRVLIPHFVQAADEIHLRRPDIEFVMALSPFLDEALLRDPLGTGAPEPCIPGQTRVATTPHGATVRLTTEPAVDVLSVCDLAIAIPGTTTLQIAALGVPQLVVLPLQRPDLIPLDGLLGLLPPKLWPMSAFRRRLAQVVGMGEGFFALPNRIAGREIVPELRGAIEPSDVAREVLALLGDAGRRERMVADCLEVTAGRGAAERIAAGVLG